MTDPATHTLLGFAQPVVAPLEDPTTETCITPGPAPMPDLAAPSVAIALENLAPRPPEQRDPTVPLVNLDPVAESTPAWTPDQPLMDITPTVDPALFPAPTGAPVIAASPTTDLAPTPRPTTTGSARPWSPAPTLDHIGPTPTNPVAPSSSTAPQGWPGNQSGPAWSGGRPPATTGPTALDRKRRNVVGWTFFLLAVAWLFPHWAWLDLALAAGFLLRNRLPGRMVTSGAAIVAGYLHVQWWLGYVATSSWESSVRILALATAAGIGLLHLQARRA